MPSHYTREAAEVFPRIIEHNDFISEAMEYAAPAARSDGDQSPPARAPPR